MAETQSAVDTTWGKPQDNVSHFFEKNKDYPPHDDDDDIVPTTTGESSAFDDDDMTDPFLIDDLPKSDSICVGACCQIEESILKEEEMMNRIDENDEKIDKKDNEEIEKKEIDEVQKFPEITEEDMKTKILEEKTHVVSEAQITFYATASTSTPDVLAIATENPTKPIEISRYLPPSPFINFEGRIGVNVCAFKGHELHLTGKYKDKEELKKIKEELDFDGDDEELYKPAIPTYYESRDLSSPSSFKTLSSSSFNVQFRQNSKKNFKNEKKDHQKKQHQKINQNDDNYHQNNKNDDDDDDDDDDDHDDDDYQLQKRESIVSFRRALTKRQSVINPDQLLLF